MARNIRRRVHIIGIKFGKKMPNISKEEFQKAVENAESKKEVILNLHITDLKSSYRTIKFLSHEYGIELPLYDPAPKKNWKRKSR